MAVTAPAEVHRDAKAGYCASCRRGSHILCASPRCACPSTSGHQSRPTPTPPTPIAVRTPPPAATKATPKTRAKRVETVWELVREDPPAPPPKAKKPRKPTLAEQAQVLLEDIVEAGSHDFHRIALCGTSSAAARIRKVLAAEFAAEWVWKSCADGAGRPCVYARWTGGES